MRLLSQLRPGSWGIIAFVQSGLDITTSGALAGCENPRCAVMEPPAQAISFENGVVSSWPSGFDGPGSDVAY
jgi:hypothetical protein